MKNIANFVLWFMLIVGILKSLFNKNVYEIKKELPKYLLASIMVNMSWFLMWALIDVANVATAAVAWFPQAIIGENVMKEKDFQKLTVSIPEKIMVKLGDDADSCQNNVYASNVSTKTLDSVWARFNDMSWPLLFLWTSIYRFQSYCTLNQDITSFKNFTIAMILKVIVLLMFIAPLVALLLINIQRIFYLWLWIVFAPIIALLEVMKVKIDLGKMKDTFSIKEIIWLVFTPVFTVGWLSLVLIMSTGMYYVMWGTPGQTPSTTPVSHVYAGAEITSSKELSTFHNTTAGSEVAFIGDVFWDLAWYAGWFIGYLIITSFTIMLLWAIVKMSVSSSKIASSTYNSVIWLGSKLASWLQIVPIGGGKTVSLWAISNPTRTFENAGQKLENKWNRNNIQNINSAFYGSKLGKGVQSTFGFTVADFNKSDMILNTGDLAKYSTTETLIPEIQNTLNANDQLDSITLRSGEFLKSTAKTMLGNPNLKKSLKDKLVTRVPIKDDEWDKITPTQLLDTKTDLWRAFIYYLQTALSNTTDKPIISIAGINISKAIPSDFTIYKKPDENAVSPPPAVVPPAWSPWSTTWTANPTPTTP